VCLIRAIVSGSSGGMCVCMCDDGNQLFWFLKDFLLSPSNDFELQHKWEQLHNSDGIDFTVRVA